MKNIEQLKVKSVPFFLYNKFSKINDPLYNFYETLFSQNNNCLDISATDILKKFNIPKLNFEEVQLGEGPITKDEISETFKR